MGIMNYARGEKLLETMVLREDLNLKRELNELTVYTTSRTAADKPSNNRLLSKAKNVCRWKGWAVRYAH